MMAAQQIGVTLRDASATEQTEFDHESFPMSAITARARINTGFPAD
jgi:hypothetical protein